MVSINQLLIGIFFFFFKKNMQSQTRNALFRPRSSNKPVRPRLHKVWTVSAISLR
ncbi:hypothetical protein M441DRAFT_139870 [Trichoderma asperellum CBS 433.97]|uniref:Uncharacterized protein n=1 Tax=Trichoderma asperellum (strain ATCC 204424 / CBS 433.97 / NBRC 101777) TaxID=1042311 RepID=A0A2T3ZA32_TRIA4|nr:hypothetical protein M441DRAFT_139870 [Trichoderma asperellum CBS 433.97]PTB41646.1 hypothetical protein M441DRAFT_139870 [Trichoderma asperellum CBS 433.97]